MRDIQSLFIKNILNGTRSNLKECGTAFAASNIALCKYWGKRAVALNLPVNSSLSISLGHLGTHTEIRQGNQDRVMLNGSEMAVNEPFVVRTLEFLDGFRPLLGNTYFEVRTQNNIPTAAGLASSASGFAALVMALNNWAGWELDGQRLSMLARLGSGSAARSIFDGFVQWNAGTNPDGSDSFAEPMAQIWPEFRIGILKISEAQKPIGSREGMNRTVATSELYKSWPAQAEADLATLRTAIDTQDFTTLGKTAEHNALSMHATMMAAWPPLIYLQPDTLEQIHTVQRVRADGLEVYLTIDAGPNIKLLFLEKTQATVAAAFPDVEIIQPFG